MRRRDVIVGSAALLFCGIPRPSRAELTNHDLISAQAELSSLLLGGLQRSYGRGRNVVVSPASLAAILATLALGADEPMRAAIRTTLRLKGKPDDFADSLRARVGEVSLNRDEQDAIFALANLVVIDPKSMPSAAVADRLRSSDTNVVIEDLSNPVTIDRINTWVAGQTRGFIQKVFDRPPRQPGLAGINALYFKGKWRDRFDPRYTETRPFRPLNGAAKAVPMMARIGSYAYRENGRFVAVDLPYKNDRFALTVTVTNDRPAAAGEFSTVADWATGENFESTTVDLSLPRFVVRGGVELLDALDSIGLKSGRVSPTAFSPLCQVPQSLSRIAQQTYLRVDEEGTEAAAATTITTSRSALRTKSVTVVVDKPFVFALRDRRSGLLLLTGYIGDLPEQNTAANG